jgi:hypothetical protein
MCSVNHDLKAIFIHIPKTAGTYISKRLEENYGFKTYLLKRPDHKSFCLSMDKTNITHENKIHGTLMYYKTSPYINNIMNMNKKKWDTYFKFCFIRNPYDRLVSGWNYVNKYNIPLANFININKSLTDWDYWHVFMNQSRHIINEKGKIGVDYIGRYEQLEEHFEVILKQIGIHNITHCKNVKINSKKHKDYKTYYDEELINKVYLQFKEDFDNFEYQPALIAPLDSVIVHTDDEINEPDEATLNNLRSIGDGGINEIC